MYSIDFVVRAVNSSSTQSNNSAEITHTFTCTSGIVQIPFDYKTRKTPSEPQTTTTPRPTTSSPLPNDRIKSGICPEGEVLKAIVSYDLVNWTLLDNLTPWGYNMNTGRTYYSLDGAAESLGYPPTMFMEVVCMPY